MHGFQHFVQSLLVVIACASDYFVIFDHWIITPPKWPTVAYHSRWVVCRRQWICVLKLALCYALLEPLWYLFMAKVTDNAMFVLISCAFLYITAGTGTMHIILRGIQDVAKEHELMCGNALRESGDVSAEPDFDENGDSVDVGENETDENGALLKDDYQSQNSFQSPTDSAYGKPGNIIPLKPGPHCPHEPSVAWKMATFIPVVFASALNASLFFYTRYLDSDDSREWLDGFAFGWTVIAMLCITVFALAKSSNIWIALALQRRPFWPVEKKNWACDTLMRCSAFVLLLAVRSLERAVLGLHAIAIPSVNVSSNGTTLVLKSDVKFGRYASLPDGDKESKEPNAFLNPPPIWLSLVLLGINIAMSAAAGIAIYRRRQRKEKTMS